MTGRKGERSEVSFGSSNFCRDEGPLEEVNCKVASGNAILIADQLSKIGSTATSNRLMFRVTLSRLLTLLIQAHQAPAETAPSSTINQHQIKEHT